MLLMVTMAALAQDKANVLVDEFTAESGYTDSDVRSLRENVIRALLKTGRVNVLDITKDSYANKQYTTIRGYLQQPSVSSQTINDGKNGVVTMSEARINYIITMILPNSGSEPISFMFTSRGQNDLEASAVTNACSLVKPNMEKMIESVFPVNGKVILVDNEKNGKAQTVYINLGANNGIKKGQKFDVTIVKDVAGDKVSKVIGTLTATEISDTKSLCSVNDGNAEVLTYLNSGTELTIKTREKKGLFKSLGNVMGNIYGGGGFVSDSGTRVQTPTANLSSVPQTIASNTGNKTQTSAALSSSGNYSYYGFVHDDGMKYIEPTFNWTFKKADILSFMKNSGYVQMSDVDLAFVRNVHEDPQGSIIRYMIMNGQFFSATAMLNKVKKDEVLTWMKAHYIYKGKEADGFSDSHNFLSRDKKTEILVSFMNINEAEYSTVTIMYQKAM